MCGGSDLSPLMPLGDCAQPPSPPSLLDALLSTVARSRPHKLPVYASYHHISLFKYKSDLTFKLYVYTANMSLPKKYSITFSQLEFYTVFFSLYIYHKCHIHIDKRTGELINGETKFNHGL